MTTSDKNKVYQVAKYGADALGGVASSIIGLLVGGPGGAALGGAIGPILTRTFAEVCERFLSQNEEVRIGQAGLLVVSRIKKYLEEGRLLRQDGFFNGKDNCRSDGEEIFEGVLLSCRDLFEEKNIPYVSNIFANAAFVDTEPEVVHFILKVSDRLTYRDLCVAAIVGRKKELDFDTNLLHNKIHMGKDQILSRSPRTELQQQKANIIRSIAAIGGNYPGMLSRGEDRYGIYKLTEIGQTVFELMGLEDIPIDDLTVLIDVLKIHETHDS